MRAPLRSPAFFRPLLWATIWAGCATTPTFAETAAPATPIGPIKPYKIILVGDSTVAVQGGWGSSFCAEHVTSTAACLNLARGGRSTSSYIEEGSWTFALREAGVAGYVRTWVLIQFGHNDQPGKPGRSTDLKTEFPVNMARYAQEVKALGGVPVLVTPLTRRTFKDGVLENNLEPWADVIRATAAAQKTPLLDLNAESHAAVQAMGQDEADTLAVVPRPPGYGAPRDPNKVEPAGAAKTAFDRTHLGTKGAEFFARMVERELVAARPETAAYFKDGGKP